MEVAEKRITSRVRTNNEEVFLLQDVDDNIPLVETIAAMVRFPVL